MLKYYVMKALQGLSEGAIIAACFLVAGTVFIFLFHYMGLAGLLLFLVFLYVAVSLTRSILNVPKKW